jgi:hypothetical protein
MQAQFITASKQTVRKNSYLMTFKKIIAVYSDKHNNLYTCAIHLNAEFRYVKPRGTYSNHSSLKI